MLKTILYRMIQLLIIFISTTNTSVITLDRKAYDKSIELCTNLLKKVKASYDKLNEVEKFIIKSLEFDNPPETD